MKTEKIPMNAIVVSTRYYERSHWTTPKGRGMYGFSIGNTEAVDDVMKAWWTKGRVTYTEACRQAKKEAQSRGVSVVYVLP